MTRALTLADIIGQLNQDSTTNIDLSPTEVLNEYIALLETGHATEASFLLSRLQMLVPYDVNIIQDASPVGFWRLNEFGNILTAVDQSFETGVGTWTAVNATQVQSTTQAKDGTHSLQVTATAAGAGATTGFYQLFVPGVTYGGSAWVFSTTAAKTFTVTVNWYTAAKGLISASTSPTITGTLNTWTQVPFVAAAPSNAAFFKVQVTEVNSVSTNLFFMDLITITYVGYDSNPFLLTQNFQKNPASSVGANSQMLIAQPGPYIYPNGGALPAGSTKFTTVNDQYSIANATQLQVSGDLSVEFWINVNSGLSGSAANTYGVLSKGYAEYGVDITGDGKVTFSFTGTTFSTAAAAVPNNGVWHHVVCTRQYAARTIVVYVDGVSKGTTTYTNAPATTTNAVTIGKSSVNNTLAGINLAEVALYGRVLSSTQVTNHYNWAGYGSPPSGEAVTGSGFGFSFAAVGGNAPAKYGQYGFTQYPSYTYPTSTLYDGGAVWGTFVWS